MYCAEHEFRGNASQFRDHLENDHGCTEARADTLISALLRDGPKEEVPFTE